MAVLMMAARHGSGAAFRPPLEELDGNQSTGIPGGACRWGL
jgi:hypothetical protein